MFSVRGYAAQSNKPPLTPFNFERRDLRPDDILIDILYCGICHSDIHTARGEWGETLFPVVPGHEIVGRVSRLGSKVKRFKSAESVGVGCFVDSCRTCPPCRKHLEQFCEKGPVFTYNSYQKDGSLTYGGYSTQIVVDQKYVLKIPRQLPLAGAAPLLCAGITTYSPLKHWKAGKGSRVGIVGLGGLGHMGVKLAASLGAEVTVLSTSASKESDAKKLGARHFVLSTNKDALNKLKRRFDLIIDTISAPHNVDELLETLVIDGTLVMVGASPDPLPIAPFSVIMGRRQVAGSLIGGIAETQEMLDFCAKKNIVSDVKVIPASKINEAYERVLKGDVRYRFVIDAKTI